MNYPETEDLIARAKAAYQKQKEEDNKRADEESVKVLQYFKDVFPELEYCKAGHNYLLGPLTLELVDHHWSSHYKYSLWDGKNEDLTIWDLASLGRYIEEMEGINDALDAFYVD